jgi:hypothetical protein
MRFTSLLRSIINASVTLKIPRTTPVIGKMTANINLSFFIIIYVEPPLTYSDSVLVLSLVLPSRQETCRFHLNLQTATVGQLIDEIKQEDAGIEHVHIYDENGKLLSKSYSINSLLNSSFTIQLNQQKTFLFDAINKLQIKNSTIRSHKKLDGPSIEDTVAALYHALNIMKIYHLKYLELKNEANQLTIQLEPLEKVNF